MSRAKNSKQNKQINIHTYTTETINEWLKHTRRYFTKRTVQQYKMVIKRFSRFAPSCISNIKIEHIEKYLDKILEKYTPTTGNAHLVAIKSFCRWYANRFHYDNPAKGIAKLVENPPRQRVLTEDEYLTVLKIAKGLEKETIQFLGNTGLRKSEFQSLTWQNISSDMKYITLTGKGRKRRIVPLNKVCRKILRQYKNSNNKSMLFIQKYQIHHLYCLCCKLAKKANIPRFGPHALRHFFATRLIRAGVSTIKVSKILGHSSIVITERIYIHLIPPDLLGVTDVLVD